MPSQHYNRGSWVLFFSLVGLKDTQPVGNWGLTAERQQQMIQKKWKLPPWNYYYTINICIWRHYLYKQTASAVWPCTVHTASTCSVIHSRRLADAWLVHSKGTNLSRQLDSLTDLTTDNPAGSFSCNNPRRGGLFCLGAVSMRHNASTPRSTLQSQRPGNNHCIKARPKSGESQIKWCGSSDLIRSSFLTEHTKPTSALDRQPCGVDVCNISSSLSACKRVSVTKQKITKP